jgi:hypothetical protein
MGETGFDNMDFLQCCKFAEGDSRILMSKITRDRLKAKEGPNDVDENILCTLLKDNIKNDEIKIKDK